MAKIGYARTSSTGQNLTLQLIRLKAFGCEEPNGVIIVESKSETDIDDARHELKTCLDKIRQGDILVVTKLDRLSRFPEKVIQIINRLSSQGASLKVIDEDIDTSTFAGKWRLKYLLLSKKFSKINDICFSSK